LNTANVSAAAAADDDDDDDKKLKFHYVGRVRPGSAEELHLLQTIDNVKGNFTALLTVCFYQSYSQLGGGHRNHTEKCLCSILF